MKQWTTYNKLQQSMYSTLKGREWINLTKITKILG